MPCDTRLKPRQTLTERKEEVRAVLARLAAGLAAGRVKTLIGPAGAVAFQGLTEAERDGVTDACLYRLTMATGSALAKQAIARAEQLAGRPISRQALTQGIHAHEHDGVLHWHHGH